MKALHAKPLYMTDSYLRKFDAVVEEVDGRNVTLSETAFYPSGGGQPTDFGTINAENGAYNVVRAFKKDGKVWHEVHGEGLQTGDKVKCEIDWERRYKLMRMHTAAHIIFTILYNKTGALATGNQLDTDQSRLDLTLESFDKETIQRYIDETNEIIQRGIEVNAYFLGREEALKIPGVVKLANVMPPDAEELRIVEIPGIDLQADGNRRIYYALE